LLFALLAYTALRLTLAPAGNAGTALLRRLSVLAVGVLALQIALGGWTSSNYAALACGNDFPKCLGFWWPPTDFREGFVLWRRIGALLTFLIVGAVAVTAARHAATRVLGAIVGALLLLQIALGIGNVVLGLPLQVAIAHNGVAALLMVA